MPLFKLFKKTSPIVVIEQPPTPHEAAIAYVRVNLVENNFNFRVHHLVENNFKLACVGVAIFTIVLLVHLFTTTRRSERRRSEEKEPADEPTKIPLSISMDDSEVTTAADSTSSSSSGGNDDDHGSSSSSVLSAGADMDIDDDDQSVDETFANFLKLVQSEEKGGVAKSHDGEDGEEVAVEARPSSSTDISDPAGPPKKKGRRSSLSKVISSTLVKRSASTNSLASKGSSSGGRGLSVGKSFSLRLSGGSTASSSKKQES